MAGKFTKNMIKVMELLLQNWYARYSNIQFQYKAYDGSTPSIGPSDNTAVRDIFSNVAAGMNSMVAGYTAPFDPSYNYNTGFIFMGFGSGDTEPTEDDYNLGEVINTLTGSSASTGMTSIGKQYTQTVTNETAESITIKEFGLYLCVYSATLQGLRPMLLYHEVLETPVTLEPNQTTSFTAELTFV